MSEMSSAVGQLAASSGVRAPTLPPSAVSDLSQYGLGIGVFRNTAALLAVSPRNFLRWNHGIRGVNAAKLLFWWIWDAGNGVQAREWARRFCLLWHLRQ